MSKRQQWIVVYTSDVPPNYQGAAKYIEDARRDPEIAARNESIAQHYKLGPYLDANPESIAVVVCESEARLDEEPAAIAGNVLQRLFYGGDGSRPPPGFGNIPAPWVRKRKAA